jgi:mRNA interferase MazF
MKRGEIWTVAGFGYAGKPRPCLIVQNDAFEALQSVTVCLLTSNEAEAALFRIAIDPSPENGPRSASKLMTDKLMTVPRDKVRERIGVLEAHYLTALSSAIVVFLGLQTPP